jgi:hypothetical protein
MKLMLIANPQCPASIKPVDQMHRSNVPNCIKIETMYLIGFMFYSNPKNKLIA